jgi:hypothetical protein
VLHGQCNKFPQLLNLYIITISTLYLIIPYNVKAIVDRTLDEVSFKAMEMSIYMPVM